MPNLRILVQDRQLRSEVIIGSRKYVPVRLVQLQPSLENDVLDIGENPLRRKKPVCIRIEKLQTSPWRYRHMELNTGGLETKTTPASRSRGQVVVTNDRMI